VSRGGVTRVGFPAMGTTCEVTVVGGRPALLGRARDRVEQLEARWSRFRQDSEISRLNRRSGFPTALSADSYLLVDHAVAGWRLTGGRYDPTVLAAITAAGYDRSFELLSAGPEGGGESRVDDRALPGPAPGCGDVLLDPHLQAVTCPVGVGIDPGGIGKGLACDLVAGELRDAGAAGVCVNLGGDGRVSGEPPLAGWRIGVANPYDEEVLLGVVTLTDHGIATSSRLLRRWSVGGAERHHLLDPRTGRSVDNAVDTVTVVAGDAWVAEVLSKAAFVAGPGPGSDLLNRVGVAGMFVEGPDRVHATAGFVDLLADQPFAVR